MLRGIPMRIRSISFSTISCFRRSRTEANGSAGMNSSGVAIIFSSSLTAKPIRFVPWSSASIRILQVLHCISSRSDRSLHCIRSVSRGEKARFELGGGLINAFLQHAVEVLCESGPIAVHRVSQIKHRSVREVCAEHGPATVELNRYSCPFGRHSHACLQLLAQFI